MLIEGLTETTNLQDDDLIVISRPSLAVGSRGKKARLSTLAALLSSLVTCTSSVFAQALSDVNVGSISCEEVLLMRDSIEAMLEDIEELQGSGGSGGGVPVGCELMLSSTTIPAGWLLCDGSEYSHDDYPALAEFLGVSSGVFNVPDRRDKFILGASASNVLGSTGGAYSVTLVRDNLPTDTPRINYQIPYYTNSYTQDNYGHELIGLCDSRPSQQSENNAFDILPPFVALNYIIKT